MALNSRPPAKPLARSEADEEAAFERAISKAPDQKPVAAKTEAAARRKPGRKAGGDYGMGISVGVGRQQLTISLPTAVLESMNRISKNSHQPRANLIVQALVNLISDPAFARFDHE